MNFFNKLGIGKKIALGFIIIIAITTIASIYSVINTTQVNQKVGVLSDQYMVEVQDLNKLTETINKLNVSSKEYIKDGNEEDYNAAKAFIIEVNEQLKVLSQFAATYPNLVVLNNNVGTLSNQVSEYSIMIDNIKNLFEIEAENLSTMSGIGTKIGDLITEMLNDQNTKLEALINSEEIDRETVQARITKVSRIYTMENSFISLRLVNTQILKKMVDTNYSEAMDTINPLLDAVVNEMEQLKVTFADETNITRADTTLAVLEDYRVATDSMYVSLVKIQEAATKADAINDEILQAINDVGSGAISNTIDTVDEVSNTLTIAMLITIIALAVMIFLAIIIAIIIIKNITGTMSLITGDLSDASSYIAGAANQLSTASDQLAAGSSEQASSIEEISATMEETSSMVAQNTENTRQAAGLSKQASVSSRLGVEQMVKMQSSMQEIKTSSNQISKIIKVIDDIAFQTNILALNAAVEAARAGDAGKGFAVVAEEVRNLAQKSAEAAKNTATMIETNIKLSEDGVVVCNAVNVSLGEINNHIENVNKLVNEITAASEEQSRGVKQVTEAMTQMEDVVQQTAATSEESAAAALELNSQAESLKGSVEELVLLVKGANADLKSDKQGTKSKQNHQKTGTTQMNRNITSDKVKKNNYVSKQNSFTVSPSEILPLDEDDDF